MPAGGYTGSYPRGGEGDVGMILLVDHLGDMAPFGGVEFWLRLKMDGRLWHGILVICFVCKIYLNDLAVDEDRIVKPLTVQKTCLSIRNNFSQN
jgi:hypothetical protein